MAEETKKKVIFNTVDYETMVKQATAVMVATDKDNNLKHWVPCIIGRAGIGKSMLAEKVASEIGKILGMPCQVISYVGSLTKDGDIGGLPVAVKDEELDITVTDYAVYVKNEQILRNDKNGIATVLFLDEINRAEKIVMDEFMELILHRELHKFKLPYYCFIMAAANPEEADSDMDDYQVNVMNPALKDRMFMYYMDTDIRSWLKWAIPYGIHEDIINFLSIHHECLYMDKSNDDMSHATPRGWEMFSDVYRVFLENPQTNKDEFLNDVLQAAIAKLGQGAAHMFINFLRENENPLISEEDILEEKIKFADVIENLKKEKENPIRLFTLCNRMVLYMDKKIKTGKWKDKYADIFTKVIYMEGVIPRDLSNGIIRDIFKNDNDEEESDKKRKIPKLTNKLKSNKDFLHKYFKLFSQFSKIDELDKLNNIESKVEIE